ncbi:MAG: hypothetical protein KDI18_14440 [Gammaproteobacteria bacterium]|nr:hypothetical protein [Gammaproteobacteria bacterium]
MAEINQPAPVKPVWPARRKQHPLKRYPDRSDEDERKRRQEPQQTDGEKSAIDEYV